MRKVFVLFLILATSTAVAKLYKWTAADGTVHYSDQPVDQAEEVQLRGLGKPAAKPSPGEVGSGAQLGDSGYSSLEIVQPGPGQTIRTDSGEVSIGVLLEPALQGGHSIRLTVDGAILNQRFSSTQLLLSKMGFGSHTLSATILDAEGNALATSASVSFHLRRAPAEAAATAE